MSAESKQPNLTILIGLPGSGKSTLAKQLDQPIVAVDDFLRDMQKGKKPTPTDNRTARDHALRTVIRHLQAGKSVVFDHTNLTPAVRADIFVALRQAQLKASVVGYYLDTDFFTCVDGNRGREFDLSPLNIFYLLLALVPPTRKEGFSRILVERRTGELSASPSLKKFLTQPTTDNLDPSALKKEVPELQLFADALAKMDEDWEANLVADFDSLSENCDENGISLDDWPELVAAWLFKDLFRIITEYFAVSHPDSDLPRGVNLNELIFDRLLRQRLANLDLRLPTVKNLLTGYFAVAEQGATPPHGATEKLLTVLLVS